MSRPHPPLWAALAVGLAAGPALGQGGGASRYPDLVRGESVQAAGQLDVLFMSTRGGARYLRLDALQVAQLRRANAACPAGISADVAATAAPARVKVFRPGGTLEGDGARVTVQLRVSASDLAAPGEQFVSVRFPFIAEFSRANPLFQTSQGSLTFGVKVWESREALARHRAELRKKEVEKQRQAEAEEQKKKDEAERLRAGRQQADEALAQKKQGEHEAALWMAAGNVLLTVVVLGAMLTLYWPRGDTTDAVVREGEELPGVCLCCGARADGTVTKWFAWSSWGGTGIIGAIAALATMRSATLRVPMCAAHRGHWAYAGWTMALAAVVVPLQLFGPLLLGDIREVVPVLVGMGCGLVSLLALLIMPSLYVIKVGAIEGPVVLLQRVSAEFARARREAEWQRNEALEALLGGPDQAGPRQEPGWPGQPPPQRKPPESDDDNPFRF